MVVENPYTQPHYLTTYFPIKPKLIDKDRERNGDHMRKPTQYWFLNCDPEENVVFESLQSVEHRVSDFMKVKDGESRKVKRSMIHPQYARRFIISHILDCDGGVWTGEAI